MNIEIKSYKDEYLNYLCGLFRPYAKETENEELDEMTVLSICTGFTKKLGDKQLLDLLYIDGAPAGFIMYQIDSPEFHWCEKEGHGFIREMYISPDYRKQGFGKILVEHAENALNNLRVPHIYLTSGNNDFWVALGYMETDEICDRNNCPIFIK